MDGDGTLWALGRHRLICGDNQDRDTVRRLLAGVVPDLLLTDPPYASGARDGAWREAQRHRGGSKGSSGDYEPVFADTLSTRGYMQLMRQMLRAVPKTLMGLIFCDWRMWCYLQDAAESANWNIRGMIVWDKLTPGLGKGFRAQHELVMLVAKTAPAFGWRRGKPAQGNVIRMARSGNEHHPLEKPVPLLEVLLDVADQSRTIYDPFTGSGSTILAAEGLDRTAYCVEIEPQHCRQAVARWEALTGERARVLSTLYQPRTALEGPRTAPATP